MKVLEDLAHDDVAHLVFLHELGLHDIAVFFPVFGLEGFAPQVNGGLALTLASLARVCGHEVEKFDDVVGGDLPVWPFLHRVEARCGELIHDVCGSGSLCIVAITEDVVVEEGGSHEGSSGGGAQDERLVLVAFDHFNACVELVCFDG